MSTAGCFRSCRISNWVAGHVSRPGRLVSGPPDGESGCSIPLSPPGTSPPRTLNGATPAGHPSLTELTLYSPTSVLDQAMHLIGEAHRVLEYTLSTFPGGTDHTPRPLRVAGRAEPAAGHFGTGPVGSAAGRRGCERGRQDEHLPGELRAGRTVKTSGAGSGEQLDEPGATSTMATVSTSGCRTTQSRTWSPRWLPPW
jgi:hypothetical protein